MSSSLQSALESLQKNDYVAVVIITAVVYDYFLTFSKEIEYVWHKPWTWVSTMFLVVRYCGLGCVISASLIGTTFFPGPLKVCNIIYIANDWAFILFLSAADSVMIARVYVLWNRSKSVLRVLLLFYVAQTVIVFVDGIYGLPGRYYSIIVSTIADFSFCNEVTFGNGLALGVVCPIVSQFVLGTALLILAIIRTSKQSVEMYKATKQWQPNRYIRRLVMDGFFYFLANILYDIGILTSFAAPSVGPNSTFGFLIGSSSYLAVFPIMPRFILSVRELYDRDLHSRRQGADTGFGVISQSTTSQNGVVSTIAFADPTARKGQDEIGEESAHEPEVIQLELALEDGTRQV